MDDKSFEKLLDSIRWMKAHQAGRKVRGGRQTVVSDLDVKKIRAATQLSQARFAELLSIEIGTLRNWEQRRREPTGPARALLRALRNDPVSVLRALRTDQTTPPHRD
jgi:putative transcriptional regulator